MEPFIMLFRRSCSEISLDQVVGLEYCQTRESSVFSTYRLSAIDFDVELLNVTGSSFTKALGDPTRDESSDKH